MCYCGFLLEHRAQKEINKSQKEKRKNLFALILSPLRVYNPSQLSFVIPSANSFTFAQQIKSELSGKKQ